MPPKRTTDPTVHHYFTHQEDPKQQKPRAGLLNDILLEHAWIGYWDDDAWTSYPKELGILSGSPWFRTFPGRTSSYIDLIERGDRVDDVALADTQPFAKEEKRGSWRVHYKSNAADPVEPTLVSYPFCPNSSIWAYKFHTNVGKDRVELFAILRKEKSIHTAKGISQEKYTYLLRDEKTYSVEYFIYVPKAGKAGRPATTPKKARGGENYGSSEQSGVAGMRHQRLPNSGQYGTTAEVSDNPGDNPPNDVTINGSADLSQNSELGDAEQMLRQFLPKTTHRAGIDRDRSETIRPDAFPQQHQQHSSRAFMDDVLPSTEYSEFREPDRTPGPAAQSKRSFPNMMSSNTATTSSDAGKIPEKEPQNAQKAGRGTPETGQKRQRGQEYEASEAGSMLPPEVPSKKLKRRTMYSGAPVAGSPESRQDEELLEEAEAFLQDEAAAQPSNSLAQSTPPASPDPEPRDALTPTDFRPPAGSKTPPHHAGRNVRREATLSIRTSATPTSPNKSPSPSLDVDFRRVRLKFRVEDGNSCDYAVHWNDCRDIQDLFRKAARSVKRELNEGDSIHHMVFYIDKVTEMCATETYIDLDDEADNFNFAMDKIKKVLKVREGRVEIFVWVNVTRRM